MAGIERPAGKVTVAPPATATGAPAPVQVVAAFGVAAITTPPGKVSISGAVRVASARLGLLKVMVSVEIPPVLMLAGLKALPSKGAAGSLQPPTVLPPAPAIVTAVFATTRPVTFALAPTVTKPVAAITVPRKLFPLSVASLPTSQNTLHGLAVPTTFDPTLAVSALFTMKTKTPGPLSVRVPKAAKSA